MEICVFTKHFQSLNIQQLAKTMVQLGVDGVDLTVRNKGYIEPQQVKKLLPEYQKILQDYGIKISMLTTGITKAEEETYSVLETAAELGIKYLKLGYWPYQGFGNLRQQEKEVKQSLKELEKLFKSFGLKAGFHTHSQFFLGINSVYVLRLIEDCDPTVIGVYYDIGHETLEGALRGWEMDLDLAAERLFMVAIKSMNLYHMGNNDDPRRGWVWRTVPLEAGMTDIGGLLKNLKEINYDGIFSFHSEYQGQFSWRDLNQQELIQQTQKDLNYFRKLLNIYY